MIVDGEQMGRSEGLWVPIADAEAHLALGWHLLDDPEDGRGPPGMLLLAPPADAEAFA